MNITACSSCWRVLNGTQVPAMEILVDGNDEEKLIICLICAKTGFQALDKKRDKNPDEVSLLAGLRKFIRDNKGFAEA